jgi:hypothetical protein
MARFWQMVTLLMLALIVPASICCHLVDSGPAEVSDCCPSHEQDGDNEPNPLSCPSDSISHSQVPESVFLPAAIFAEPFILAPGETALRDSEDLVASRSRFHPEAPPDLTPKWSFAHRTSLPARAPSAAA